MIVKPMDRFTALVLADLKLVLVAADKISFIIPLHQPRAARLEAGKLI